MVDVAKLKYSVFVVGDDGTQYNIKNYIEALGWEEANKEISMRLTFKARNDDTSKGQLSSIVKLGSLIVVTASDGGSFNGEVARGFVEKWNPQDRNSASDLSCICYDELYKLQKSQDNVYLPDGTGTQSAIQKILDGWGVTLGQYKGPNATHGKLTFKNKYLSDIMLELLDDAVKKGGEKCVILATKGKAEIVPLGGNDDVYVFKLDNTISVSNSLSTEDLVTRVKVVGQENKSGQSKVEATLDGLTQYGTRQRIYRRGSDEKLADAKSAAQAILDEDGKVVEEVSVNTPDIPWLRKGYLVRLKAGTSQGNYYVRGVVHNAESLTMTLDLLKAPDEGKDTGGKHSVGDVVNFHGGTHYVSSYADAKGYKATAGKAKITKEPSCAKNGGAHPWHLIHVDSSSNVYGWVDEGTFD